MSWECTVICHDIKIVRLFYVGDRRREINIGAEKEREWETSRNVFRMSYYGKIRKLFLQFIFQTTYIHIKWWYERWCEHPNSLNVSERVGVWATKRIHRGEHCVCWIFSNALLSRVYACSYFNVTCVSCQAYSHFKKKKKEEYIHHFRRKNKNGVTANAWQSVAWMVECEQ